MFIPTRVVQRRAPEVVADLAADAAVGERDGVAMARGDQAGIDVELHAADAYAVLPAVVLLFHEEEELVESHRSTIVGMQQWTKDDLSLLNMTNEVDYDQDGKHN